MFEFTEQRSEKTDYLVGQEWTVLTKTLKEYQKAKSQADSEKMIKLANKIIVIQKNLGLKETKFPELGL